MSDSVYWCQACSTNRVDVDGTICCACRRRYEVYPVVEGAKWTDEKTGKVFIHKDGKWLIRQDTPSIESELGKNLIALDELEDDYESARRWRDIWFFVAAVSVGLLVLIALDKYLTARRVSGVLTIQRALRFDNYMIVPVTPEQYHVFTNKYPANVVDYPLIFK